MRIIISLILFISSAFANAQSNPLFKIISCSEGVTLDGVEVKPGLIVYDNSIKLEIPKNGYAGVMTIEGYAHVFAKNVKTNLINKKVRKIFERPTVRPWGAVHRSSPYPFKFAGDIRNQFSNIYGDSVFIAFKCYYNDDPPPFKITFLNMFDDILNIDTLNNNWKVFNVRNLLNSEIAILYKVNSARHGSDIMLIKLPSKEFISKVSFDFERLVKDPATQLALYEIKGLYYDQIFFLYKLEKHESFDLDAISAAYLSKTREKYQLSQYYNK